MSARGYLVLPALLALATPCPAGQDPNIRRGIAPGNVYRSFGIDTINEFTGSIVLQIPLADAPVGPFLTQALQLTYNSAIYDYEFAYDSAVSCPGLKRRAIPETFSNSGLGWSLSLGRLLPPGTGGGGENGGLRYRSPTGSEHTFTLGGEAAESTTHDGSFLRLRRDPANLTLPVSSWEIDMPDGTIHKFKPAGDLEEIRDRVGHTITITYTYDPDGHPERWEIDSRYDGHSFRRVTVHFERRAAPAPHVYKPNFLSVVSSI